MSNHNQQRSNQQGSKPGAPAPMGMDEDTPPTVAETIVGRPLRAGQGQTPVCGIHCCVMTAVSTQGQTTYYQCPVPCCKESDKLIRDRRAVFSAPIKCPRQGCGSYLEKDVRLSTGPQLAMRCPACDHVSRTQKPELALVRPGRRTVAADTGDR